MGLNRRTFVGGAKHFGFTIEQLTLLTTITQSAPTTADYLVKTSSAELSAERVVTDTTSVVWDWSTGGQAKATVVGFANFVAGPASAVDGRVVLFDGTTGKLIKDSGLTLSGSNTGDETAAGILAKLLTVDGASSGLDADLLDGHDSAYFATAAAAGTVTTVSVTSANGVSGSVANATTTPAITLTLGAITPTSVAASGTVTGSNLSGTNTGDQTSVTGNAGTATTLATARAIYGNNFDGSAALTQVIASTYGGTGNGFTKFTGPTTAEKTFTLPNSSETLLYAGGPLGTPSSGTLTNATGLPISTGVSGLGAGVATFLATASSANLAAAISDETGSGALVFAASPALTGSPTTPTQTAGDNSTKIASTAYVRTAAGVGRYHPLLRFGGSLTAGQVAGTYGMGISNALVLVATGTLYPIQIIHIVGADYPTTLDGLSPKLRLKMQLYTNDVAPTGNYTIGLYPISRPATSGGAGLCIYTYGTVVTGSNGASYTTPAADSSGYSAGSDFALPSDGAYAVALVTTATVAANSHIHIVGELQMHYA